MKKLFRSILRGIKDSIPLLATAKDHTIKEPDGTTLIKFDWPRLLTSFIVVGLILAFVFGKITVEDLLSLLDRFQ